MSNILLKNAKICREDGDIVTDILVRDGIIKEIGKDCGISFDTKIIEVNERYVLPGLIDLNCEVCEPGFDYREDLKSVSLGAARSGFTSLTASPHTDPVIDNRILVKHLKILAKEKSVVNIFPYGDMTKDGMGEELSDMGEMYNEGIVAISDGNKSVVDSFILSNVLNYANMFDLPVITFCDSRLLNDKGIVNDGLASTMTGLKGIPASAEEVYVARNLILANERKCKIHITKVSTAGSVELIRFGKKMGVEISADTCPQYITFNEKQLIDYDTYYKMLPPLRRESDNVALIKGLMDGTIDAISTGHYPEHGATKKIEFESASFGFSGIEPAFLVCYNKLVVDGHLSLFELVNKMSKNAYDIVKIKNKGVITEGYDADIFIFDDKAETVVDEKTLLSKAKYSVYNGMELKGSVDLTIVGGRIVFDIND